ncbi:uncharacterized protein A1O5_09648 [Cladophialophora psammophila CBS 110553]|uniref:Major facilitator superfamily (MFS) profile domain-containing protein n=1 Tax=Cladophialophora psammophila CBS 110553 TaxID=1182543 RepID=W9WFW3_9EURO|nr:uncharacterized protein A1O5_09648 [Cladophialophora psammophila CBS 110553]EXJ67002.1 hypothetical protein A1O5_09648 [Cladophialophora psammophila CBS 110553]
MSDSEKSLPPVVISQYPNSHCASPQTPIHKEFYSPTTEQSPTSSVSRSDSDNDERALTLTITQASRQSATRTATRITTHGTDLTLDPSFEVDFDPDDPGNPRNWSIWYKSFAIFTISFGTLGVVMYSTSYTSGMDAMMQEFGVKSEPIATLGVTTYLFGLAVGSLLLAPIAETYGRKPVYTICMAIFTVLVLPTAVATDLQTVIITRFFGAVFGSAMIANAPGSIADLVSDEYRATAFSIWSIGPMNGPVVGPTIGGFVTEYLGWRWTNWIAMIWGGCAFVLLILLKETYAPVLLQRRAKNLRRVHDDERYWSRYDIRVGFVELMKINLSRPFIMAVQEKICIFWNLYISIVYGILYLCFVAYPIVFTELRGWSTGISGLSFLGIGIGTMAIICSASPIRKLINSHKRDQDGNVPPEAMMSIVCIAAVLVPVGELWFAWTCYPTKIHWAISIAAGIPFGFGNGAVFIYAGNYLAYSYGIYAASAMAGNAVMRSFLGGTLPLAGPAMYRALGPNWAGTLLGILEVIIIPIPFLFYRYGNRIREKSTLIRQMREDEERQERKRRKAEERLRIAVMSGDEEETKEARNELVRVRSRLDDEKNLEVAGQETLNCIQGLGPGKETV